MNKINNNKNKNKVEYKLKKLLLQETAFSLEEIENVAGTGSLS